MNYKIEIENWDKLGIENVNFVLKLSQVKEDYLLNVSDKITARAFSMVKILLPTVIILISLLIAEINKGVFDLELIIFLVVNILTGMYLTYHFYKLTFPRVYYGQGREPNEIFENEKLIIKGNDSMLALTLCEIENSQNKVNKNKEQNIDRSNKLKRLMLLVFLLALISTVIFILVVLVLH